MNPAWGPTSAPDDNVYSVLNGVLSIAIKPLPSDVNPSDVDGAAALSGQLNTSKSFSQTYGYFEVRAKMPVGVGVGSAFWLLPTDGSWPPELDVVEINGSTPTTLIMTSHWQDSNGKAQANPTWANIPDPSQDFHTYGVDWEADKLTWYFDGKEVAQQDTPPGMNKPMFLLLDDLTGNSSSWLGAADPNTNTSMQVDYVRAYSATGSGTGSASTISSNAWYNLVSQTSSKCLDAAGWGTNDGTPAIQWVCGSQQNNQEWQLQSTDSGYYTIVNRNAPNEVLDVTGMGTAPGTKVELWQNLNGSNQQWMPVPLGNGSYKLVGRQSGLCLDVPGSSTENGTNLQIWNCNGTGAQAFQLTQQP